MLLSDLLRALPGLVVVCLVPGFAAATALAPRWAWWERLAASPVLAAGLAGIAGLVAHDAGVGFTIWTYLPVVAAVAGAALVRGFRGAREGRRVEPAAGKRTVAAVVGIALAAGVAGASILAATLRDAPLPPERDSAVHGAVAVAIAQTHDVLPAIAEPVDQSAWIRNRTGFETAAALVSETFGPSPSASMLPVVLLAVLLLPLGIVALAWEASRRAWLAACVAPLALLTAFPAWPITFGELPLVVDTAAVVPLVLAALRTIRGEGTAEAVAIGAACVAANWVVHGTEVFTAAVVGGPLLLSALWDERRRGGPVRAIAGGAACLVAAGVATVLTRLPAVPPSTPGPAAVAGVPETSDFSALVGHRSLSTAWSELTGFQPAWQLLAALALVGAVAAFRSRRLRWLVVAELAVLALYFDSVSVGVLRKAYVATYPWSTDDRLMAMQVFVLAPLAALGLVTFGELLFRAAPRPAWRVAPAAALAATGAFLGLVHARAVYTDALASHPVITAADVAALRQMAAKLPAGAVVLSDDGDAGVWVSALTPQTLYESWPYLRSHFDDPRIVALGQACEDGATLDAGLFAGIDVIYVGAREVDGLPRWDASCIGRAPWLHRVVSVTSGGDTASVFVIDRAALSASVSRAPR